jgi:hypothetical protein
VAWQYSSFRPGELNDTLCAEFGAFGGDISSQALSDCLSKPISLNFRFACYQAFVADLWVILKPLNGGSPGRLLSLLHGILLLLLWGSNVG